MTMTAAVRFLGACIFASVSLVLAAFGLVSFGFWFGANAVIFFLALDLRIVPPDEAEYDETHPTGTDRSGSRHAKQESSPFKTRIISDLPRNGT